MHNLINSNKPLVDMSKVKVVRGVGKELFRMKCPKCGKINQELYIGPASNGEAVCFTCLKLQQVAYNAKKQAKES